MGVTDGSADGHEGLALTFHDGRRALLRAHGDRAEGATINSLSISSTRIAFQNLWPCRWSCVAAGISAAVAQFFLTLPADLESTACTRLKTQP